MFDLQVERIRINIVTKTWRFEVIEHAFELSNAKDFVKTLQKESIVYVFITCNIIKTQIIDFKVKIMNSNAKRIKNAARTQMLFIELKEYKDVFSTKNVEKLSLHESHVHVIKTTTKSLYDLLYNLLNIELTTLKQYLNDVLTKKWIKHFISSTNALILFVFQKK